MSTQIEWANPPGFKGEGWPIVTGCTPVSPGCANCWGARQASGRLRHHRCYKGLTHGGKWTGEVRFNDYILDAPCHWRTPRCVFVCPSSDLFHEDVPNWEIRTVLDVVDECPQHRSLLLTKRPERMRDLLQWRYGDNPPAHLGVGVSCEDQQRADERVPILLQCPAALRFVSVEPMLGALQLSKWFRPMRWIECPCGRGFWPVEANPCRCNPRCNCRTWAECNHDERWTLACPRCGKCACGRVRRWRAEGRIGEVEHSGFDWCLDKAKWKRMLDWVIIGCESGPKRRAQEPNWVHDLLDQCVVAGVSAFNKQMDLYGRVSHDPAEWHEWARVRQWPTQFFQ